MDSNQNTSAEERFKNIMEKLRQEDQAGSGRTRIY